MLIPRLLTATAGLLLSACGGDREGDAVDLVPVLERAEAFDIPGLRDALRTVAGPAEVQSRPVQNPYDPTAVDSIRTLYHEGVAASFYWVASSGQELIEAVVVSSPRVDAGLGFRVGATREDVRRAMGEPGREEPESWSWDLYQGPDDPTPTALTVRFGDDGRVRAIRWEYYLG